MAENPLTQVRPRVTFAVLGYNQEHFIADAIEGALAQDYCDLEIILSDDCSSDRTHDRMLAAQRNYAGQHSLIVNRTAANAGTLAHVRDVFGKSSGELLLLGAGDDISYPERVSRTVEHWQRSRAQALCAKYDVIDDSGTIIEYGYAWPRDLFEFRDYFPGREVINIHGASSAYARSFLETVQFPVKPILFEDTFFTLFIYAAGGRVHFIDEALVKYRRHSQSATNADYFDSDPTIVRRREAAAQRLAGSVADVVECFGERVRASSTAVGVDMKKLEADRRFYRHRASWMQASALKRVGALFRARRKEHATWAAVRLLGIGAFVRMKALQSSARRVVSAGRGQGV